MSEKFNPQEYMTYIKDKPYLKPAHRILWFKLENGHDGSITTELVQIDPFPIVKAYVHLKGEVIASAYGTAQVKQGTVYFGREVEKAETAAIGRALSYAGYGTQFSEDDEEENLADSPIGKSRQNRATSPAVGNNPPPPAQNAKQTPSSAKNGQSGNGAAKHFACAKMTVLKRGENQFQYIAKCGHNINIVEFSRDKYRAVLGEQVETWNIDVPPQGKVLSFEPELQLEAVADGQGFKLVRVIG